MLEVSSVIPSEEAHRFLEEELVDSPFTKATFLTFWQLTRNRIMLNPESREPELTLDNGGMELIGGSHISDRRSIIRARLTIAKGRSLLNGNPSPSRLEAMLYVGEIVDEGISDPLLTFRAEDRDYLKTRVGNIDLFSNPGKGLFMNTDYSNWCMEVFNGLRSNVDEIPEERFHLGLPGGF